MKPQITLLTIRALQRDVTELNVGTIAVHTEFIARHDPCFKTWYGPTQLASSVSRLSVAERKSRVLDVLMVMEWEIRKRTRQRLKG